MRRLGGPHYFTTFTANPHWEEVRAETFPGISPSQRHDVIVRVFKLKLDRLLRDIKGLDENGRAHNEGGIFGKCIGDVYVIEYQKRGLPHAHILVFMSGADRPLTPEIIDEVVSAELPTEEEDPTGELTELVKSCMVHGPCGPEYPNQPCMKQFKPGEPKRCVKNFPKPFQETTIVPEDGYPLYRRRQSSPTFQKLIDGKMVTLDCRWIVPYNPFLLKKYKAHINFEICATVRALKYIHKYIYKGCDRATVRVEDRDDEISMTLNGRVITPSMAIWNILAYRSHEEKPPVKLLSYHLEGRHKVRFDTFMTSEQLEYEAERQKSEFTAWMDYNRSHDDGNLQLKYQDFPSAYVFDTRTRQWSKRKTHTFAIGRLYGANPNQGEYFHLWRLLQRRCGAKNYADLYTVDGVSYSKPSEACNAMGLNFNDDEWKDFFNEVKHASTGENMRTLFVNACVHGNIRDGRALFDQFKQFFCDDLPTRARQRRIFNIPHLEPNPYHDYALFLLREMFSEFGHDLEDFNLPQPVHDWEPANQNPQLAAELYDREGQQTLFEQKHSTLTKGQRTAFDTITDAVHHNPSSAHFFVQGRAGTGKTFLYKTLCHRFRARGDVVLCVASSGIAAQLLPGGRTSHSRFKIPLSGDESSKCNIPKQSQLAHLIRQTKLIIWDEVPMQHKFCFTAVHRTLCDALDTPLDGPLFGGIPCVFGGDFAQILPVIHGGSRSDVVTASIQYCHVWAKLRVLFLTEDMRLRRNAANLAYTNWLHRLPYDASLYGSVQLPDEVRPSVFFSLTPFSLTHTHPNINPPGNYHYRPTISPRSRLSSACH